MNFEGNGIFLSLDFWQGVGLCLTVWGLAPLPRKVRAWWKGPYA
jgi:hypothetical protein